MLGLSYGELFLLLGATAAVIGPKDLPMIARTLGRLAGRSIGYVQLARGQLDNIMQQSQARQVHKELQDTMAQLEAIRQEIRTISFVNPGPMTRRLVDNIDQISSASNDIKDELEGQAQGEESTDELQKPVMTESRVELQKPTQIESRLNTKIPQNFTSVPSGFSDMHSKATAYEKLAESGELSSVPMTSSEMIKELTDESGLLVLPVSAESTGLLPKRKGDAAGSDVLLEAILEAEVARNAKDFFAQHQNQQSDHFDGDCWYEPELFGSEDIMIPLQSAGHLELWVNLYAGNIQLQAGKASVLADFHPSPGDKPTPSVGKASIEGFLSLLINSDDLHEKLLEN